VLSAPGHSPAERWTRQRSSVQQETAVVRPHRSTTYLDAARCYRPSSVACWSVCLSVSLLVCHTSEPCKNGCTDRDAVWVEDLGGPREPCIRWGSRSPMERGNFEGGKGRPIVKYRDTLWTFVQKQLIWSRCRLGSGLGLAVGIVLDEGPKVLRDVAVATNFGTQFAITCFVGYNFSCVIPSDTMFDSGGGFLWSSYLMKT